MMYSSGSVFEGSLLLRKYGAAITRSNVRVCPAVSVNVVPAFWFHCRTDAFGERMYPFLA